MRAMFLTVMAVALCSGCAMLPKGRLRTCIDNMRILNDAKERCAAAENLRNGQVAPAAKILAYVEKPERIRCPSGGTYSIRPVGQYPACSVHGSLNEARRAFARGGPPRR